MNFLNTFLFGDTTNKPLSPLPLEDEMDKINHKRIYAQVMYELTNSSIELNHPEVYDYLYGWILGRGTLKVSRQNKEYIIFNIKKSEYSLFKNVVYHILKNVNFYIEYTEFLFVKNFFVVIKDLNLVKKFKNYTKGSINNESIYFYRGYFESIESEIETKNSMIDCRITDTYVIDYFEPFIRKYNAWCCAKNCYVWHDMRAIEFLSELYNHTGNIMSDIDYVLQLSSNVDKLLEAKLFKNLLNLPILVCHKICKEAVYPYKTSSTDCDYNLHLVSKVKEEHGIHYFTTGLKMSCDYGHYLEVYTQDLYKQGYILATGTPMIINNRIEEEIIVPLIKIENITTTTTREPLIVKLVPKKIHLVEIINYNSLLPHLPHLQSPEISLGP